jgi:hypothetical protein
VTASPSPHVYHTIGFWRITERVTGRYVVTLPIPGWDPSLGVPLWVHVRPVNTYDLEWIPVDA